MNQWKRIWRYEINVEKGRPGEHAVMMPARSKIISVQPQNENVVIWVIVDPTRVLAERHFLAVPSGYGFIEIPDMTHIGTCQFGGGNPVLHIFDLGEKSS